MLRGYYSNIHTVPHAVRVSDTFFQPQFQMIMMDHPFCVATCITIASNAKMSCHSSLLDRGSSAHEQATSQPLPWQATSPPAQCTMVFFMNLLVTWKYGCPWSPFFLSFGYERLCKPDNTFLEWQIFGLASNAKMSCHSSLLDRGSSPRVHTLVKF